MKTTVLPVLDELSDLLSYPGEGYAGRARNCLPLLQGSYQEAADRLALFSEGIEGLNTRQLQERFTSTFDLNPVSALEIGWHLFGENYERGAFMVRMRGELKRLKVEESTELPDHLSHVLRAIGRMDACQAARFIRSGVLPALNKMLQAFKGKQNLFENLLQAVTCVLKSYADSADQEEVMA